MNRVACNLNIIFIGLTMSPHIRNLTIIERSEPAADRRLNVYDAHVPYI